MFTRLVMDEQMDGTNRWTDDDDDDVMWCVTCTACYVYATCVYGNTATVRVRVRVRVIKTYNIITHPSSNVTVATLSC